MPRRLLAPATPTTQDPGGATAGAVRLGPEREYGECVQAVTMAPELNSVTLYMYSDLSQGVKNDDDILRLYLLKY
ncbi:MAG: hypothetical protein K0U66_01320 [Gammaproteobacteria bacterium]|nr:hypothetical protein [Gammaproteobacteria bacterium]